MVSEGDNAYLPVESFSTRSFESLIDGLIILLLSYCPRCFSTRSFESLIDGISRTPTVTEVENVSVLGLSSR